MAKKPQQPLQVKLSELGPPKLPRSRRGPKYVKTNETSQFMNPPAGFVGEWNSLSEWFIYLALWYVLKEEGDPRQPPFDGGYRFTYQAPIFGGRSFLGGQVVDFVVTLRDGSQVGLYVQTARWHSEGGPEREAMDNEALLNATAVFRVAPIYEGDFIRDPSGEAACRSVVNALGGRSAIGPSSTGVYLQARAGKMYAR